MNLNIDLLSLQAFLTVCAEGSLARAAHKLFLSEPAVSVRMRRLEDKLGIKLLIRSQRGVRPTYAGDLLRPVFEQLLGGLDASIVEAQAAAKRWTTRIVFWTPTAFMPYVLAGVLARLAEAHSHVQLVARSESSEDVLPPLLDGRIDCAILPEAGRPRLRSGYQSVLVMRDTIGLLLAPEHPLARRQQLTPADLAPYRLLSYDPTRMYWQIVKAALAGTALNLNDALTVGSLEARNELVKQQVGISFCPEVGVLPELRRAELAFRPLCFQSGAAVEVLCWFCFPEGHPLTAELSDIRDVVMASSAALRAQLEQAMGSVTGCLTIP